VALRVYLCQSMFQRPAPFRDPRFDISKLSTSLYGMGFDRDFLLKCEYQYFWNFASLFPALHDGSFYGNRVGGQSRGQGDLRGFATFLCGTFADAPWHRTELNDRFEESLRNDGYQFVGRRLVETGLDTTVPGEIASLPNKGVLRDELRTQMQIGELVAILFLDLDHFKEVNDKVSHAEGDRCLTEVVRVIAPLLRRKGKLYRIGGDEFCAMLPNFSAPEATATAEGLRKLIDALPPFGGVVKVTASIGVATSNATGLETPEALINAADEAMYVAKFTTENRVCLWPPEPSEARQAAEKRKNLVGIEDATRPFLPGILRPIFDLITLIGSNRV